MIQTHVSRSVYTLHVLPFLFNIFIVFLRARENYSVIAKKKKKMICLKYQLDGVFELQCHRIHLTFGTLILSDKVVPYMNKSTRRSKINRFHLFSQNLKLTADKLPSGLYLTPV